MGKPIAGFGALGIENDSLPLTPPSPLRRGRNCIEHLEGLIRFGSIQREAFAWKMRVFRKLVLVKTMAVCETRTRTRTMETIAATKNPPDFLGRAVESSAIRTCR